MSNGVSDRQWHTREQHLATRKRLRVALVALLAASAPAMATLFVANPASAQNVPTGSVGAFGKAISYGAPEGSQLDAPLVGMGSTHDGTGYWLLGADGGVFTYGDAGFYGSEGGSGALAPFVGIAPTPDGKGNWIAGDVGNVYNYGDATNESTTVAASFSAPVIGIAATPTGTGYWLDAADGGVFSFGDAAFYGSMGAKPLAPARLSSRLQALPTVAATGS